MAPDTQEEQSIKFKIEIQHNEDIEKKLLDDRDVHQARVSTKFEGDLGTGARAASSTTKPVQQSNQEKVKDGRIYVKSRYKAPSNPTPRLGNIYKYTSTKVQNNKDETAHKNNSEDEDEEIEISRGVYFNHLADEWRQAKGNEEYENARPDWDNWFDRQSSGCVDSKGEGTEDTTTTTTSPTETKFNLNINKNDNDFINIDIGNQNRKGDISQPFIYVCPSSRRKLAARKPDNINTTTTTDNLVQLKNNISYHNKAIQLKRNVAKYKISTDIQSNSNNTRQNILSMSNDLSNNYELYLKLISKKELQYLSNDFNNIYNKFVKKINNIDNIHLNINISTTNTNKEVNNSYIESAIKDTKEEDALLGCHNNDDTKEVIVTDDVLNNVDNIDDDDNMYDVVIVFVHDNVISNNETFLKKHKGRKDTYGWLYFVRFVFSVKKFQRSKSVIFRRTLILIIILSPPRLTYIGYDFGEDFIG